MLRGGGRVKLFYFTCVGSLKCRGLGVFPGMAGPSRDTGGCFLFLGMAGGCFLFLGMAGKKTLRPIDGWVPLSRILVSDRFFELFKVLRNLVCNASKKIVK